MEKTGRERLITRIQIALAVLAVAGLAWIGWKAYDYTQAQGVYDGIASDYADSTAAKEGPACPVDLAKLKTDYPETVGWLQIDSLDLGYPVMQAADNDTYLHVDAQGNPSIDGAIFLDYRVKSVDDDWQSIVYGHNMIDGSMFGNLSRFADPAWFSENDTTFTYFSLDGAYVYQVFAVQVVDPTDDIYQLGFQDRKVFAGVVDNLAQGTMVDTGVKASGKDVIMTLSTCSNANRLAVSAKRIESYPAR